ncbi:MAG: RNA polymerase sporulation sigma factor SigH [Armatimonadota bacterium]|nr:RNA polymerase sporulation sigma factor SigH [bacterium]
MAPTALLDLTMSSRFSKLDDEQLAEFARAGCPQATEYLLKRYRGFVEGKARSYFLAGAEQEDVVQEGMIGLFKAIRDFQAEKPARFRSFVDLCVTRQIITAVKSATRFKHGMLSDCVSLDASPGDDGGSLLDLVADTGAADPEKVMLERQVAGAACAEAVGGLSHLERAALKGYLGGRSYRQMAERLRKSPKTVDNALQRAKKKVGRVLMELN